MGSREVASLLEKSTLIAFFKKRKLLLKIWQAHLK
jgi:hypothetical protein